MSFIFNFATITKNGKELEKRKFRKIRGHSKESLLQIRLKHFYEN